MKRIYCYILLLGVAMASMATDERLDKINAIKKNCDFLYGEATMATIEEATSLAYERLQKEVLEWSQGENVRISIKSAKDINQLADTILTRRAEMYRIFAYVEKSKLLTLTEDSNAKKDSTLLNDSVKQIINERFFGQNGKKKQRMNDALLRIKNAKNFFELQSIMQPLKEQGDIIDYGKYATAQNVESCYLIIYDPAGNICALLGKGNDVRPNLKTGRDDSISNYRGCGAIWFILKEEMK